VLRPRVERADADTVGVRLRAGDQASAPADLRAHRGPLRTIAVVVRTFRSAVSGRPKGLHYSELCQTARPMKNGPSRSRYSDVCCVFRMDWTIAESGYRSFPIKPTTKSLSSLSRPWQASRTSCA